MKLSRRQKRILKRKLKRIAGDAVAVIVGAGMFVGLFIAWANEPMPDWSEYIEENHIGMVQVEAAEGELANYAVELLSAGATSERQAAEISDLMFIVDAAGRIGSRCGEAAALYGERLSSKKPFSDEAREELAESAAMVADMYDAVLRFLSDGGTASEQVLDERRRQIVKRQSRARKAHFRRVGSRQCAPENKAVYNQLLLCLERAGNECSNLVEHGAELSMWGDALGADRPGSHDGGAPPVAKRSEAPVDELAEALA